MIELIKDFGLILVVCKCLGLLSRRLGAPQVVGFVVNRTIEFLDKIFPHTQRIPIF